VESSQSEEHSSPEKNQNRGASWIVEANSTSKLLHGQSLPMTAVMSSIGHHFPSIKNIYQ